MLALVVPQVPTMDQWQPDQFVGVSDHLQMMFGHSYWDHAYLNSNVVILSLHDPGAALETAGIKLGEECLCKVTEKF
jgi:hypothetical protein